MKLSQITSLSGSAEDKVGQSKDTYSDIETQVELI